MNVKGAIRNIMPTTTTTVFELYLQQPHTPETLTRIRELREQLLAEGNMGEAAILNRFFQLEAVPEVAPVIAVAAEATVSVEQAPTSKVTIELQKVLGYFCARNYARAIAA